LSITELRHAIGLKFTETPVMDAESVSNKYDCVTPDALSQCVLNLRAYGSARDERCAARPAQLRSASLLAWGRLFLPKHFARAPSGMHQWLSDQLDAFHTARGSKLNLIGPRGSAKSTIATLCYVLRAAVEVWEPYIWIVSDTIPQAQMHLENVKTQLLENRRLAEFYPRAVGRGPTWRAELVELPTGTAIEALSTGQRIRGRRFNEHRPSLIICDDLQNDSHIASASQREVSRRWFHGLLMRAGDPRTNIINLATALHREALAMELLGAAGWTSRRFAAIQSWPTNLELWTQWEAIYADAENPNARHDARAFYDARKQEMDAGASVLWEAEEDLYTLMRMRVESGRTAFEREKQGSPVDPELCEWPEEYFGNHIWFDAWPEGLVLRAVALDPSKGRDSARGDYSAYVLLGIDAAGMIYVEADMAKRPTPQMVTDGVAICIRFRPTLFGVEANQFQELLCGEFAAEFARQRMAHIIPAAIHNQANKLVRIRRLGPCLSQRRLRFLARSPSTKLLVDQLRDFPAGAHDDGPDALEMALRLAEDAWHGRNADDGLGNRLPVG
jgi:predicted phage terminase large subunit-like protein